MLEAWVVHALDAAADARNRATAKALADDGAPAAQRRRLRSSSQQFER